MQLRHFVSGSSVILVGWLAVTFFHQVPSQRYPKLDKYPTTAKAKPAAKPGTADAAPENEVAAVSGSR